MKMSINYIVWRARTLCWSGLVTTFSAVLAAGLLTASTSLGGSLSPDFNQPGNITIADQFNNRVIEVDTAGNIIWQFGLGPTDFTPRSIIGCNDAQRVGFFTLMAGT